MLCTAPMKVGGGQLPCGQCIACRINQARKWNARLRLEWFQSSHETGLPGVFVTLTYSPENLPEGGTLVKADLQNFVKRFRKALYEDTGRFVRFYAVGEYGEARGRPHYHVIFFGVDPEWVNRKLASIWKLGLVHVGTISEGSIAYVADYCLKELRGPSSSLGGLLPQFRLMSRRPGIGGRVWAAIAAAMSGEAIADDLDEKGGPREVRVNAGNGKSELLPLDRYMRRGVERLLALDGRAVDNFARQLRHAYSMPLMTAAEIEERRRASAARALAKKARRARKAKL